MELDFRIVIPARFGSTRLPGKPLLQLAGRPMIEHVWQRAQEAGAREIIVATDDERIVEVVRGFGGDALMTSPSHASGTDRLAEVARVRGWPGDAVVVNLQGDEPLMPGRLLQRVAAALVAHPAARIATVATRIREAAELFDPNVVKVVMDGEQFALYFSRAPIPWVRGRFAAGELAGELPPDTAFFRHFGTYAYRVEVLQLLASAPLAPLEAAEALEQLRALALGARIFVEISGQALAHGVDTPSDLRLVEELLVQSQRRAGGER